LTAGLWLRQWTGTTVCQTISRELKIRYETPQVQVFNIQEVPERRFLIGTAQATLVIMRHPTNPKTRLKITLVLIMVFTTWLGRFHDWFGRQQLIARRGSNTKHQSRSGFQDHKILWDWCIAYLPSAVGGAAQDGSDERRDYPFEKRMILNGTTVDVPRWEQARQFWWIRPLQHRRKRKHQEVDPSELEVNLVTTKSGRQLHLKWCM
jgi:hypothetical protein